MESIGQQPYGSASAPNPAYHYDIEPDTEAAPERKKSSRFPSIHMSKRVIVIGVVAVAAVFGVVAGVTIGATNEANSASASETFPSKMVAEFSMNTSGFATDVPEDGAEVIDTDGYTQHGFCSSSEPFLLDLGSGEGSLSIYVLSPGAAPVLEFVTPSDGEISPMGAGYDSFAHLVGESFPSESLSQYNAEYTVVNTNGAAARVLCSQANSALVLVIGGDNSEVSLSADIERTLFSPTDIASGSIGVNTAAVNFADGAFSNLEILDNSRLRMRRLSSSAVEISHDHRKLTEGAITSVQVAVTTTGGAKVYRTLSYEYRVEVQPQELSLAAEAVDLNGDFVLSFSGVEYLGDAELKVQARLGMRVGSTTYDCVDTAAYVSDATLTIHGDWIDICVQEFDISIETCDTETCEIVLVDAVISDPEKRHAAVGRLSSVLSLTSNDARRLLGDKLHRRRLSQLTTEITDDMLEGRPPPITMHGRSLASKPHKKLLIHGYCAIESPFQAKHFSNYLEFKHPGNTNGARWSIRTFSRNIISFLNSKGYSYSSGNTCGLIAHSQGGMASLHTLTYFRTCLDNAREAGSGMRLVQTVGTPFQGTQAVNAAWIFQILAQTQGFGGGCGLVTDLRPSDAVNWLSKIPQSKRKEVSFWRTQYPTNWRARVFNYDWCIPGAGALIGSPNDGITPVSRGFLSGGQNRGVKESLCHVGRPTMRHRSQCWDQDNNSVMNKYGELNP